VIALSIPAIGPESPAREPQIAVSGSTVALTYGAGNAVYFMKSTDSGKSFSVAIKIADGGIVPLSRHRGPRIAFAGSAIIVNAVVGQKPADGPHAHGLPSDGDLMSWRSTDGGSTWSKGVRINDVAGAPTEGLHGLASDGQGRLFSVWLDKRSGAGTKLYGALSRDGGINWSKNVMIYESPDGTICECCDPSVAIDSGGQIFVMWRNWLAGSRDMYLARSRDGVTFSRPEKLGTDTWKLNACPMDGGGLAFSGGKLVSVWRREHEIFMAIPGEKEIGLADGNDIALAGSARGIYAIWSGAGGIQALVPGKLSPITVAAKGSFPSIAALPDGRAVAAWEAEGAIQVQIVPGK
jgi:hypothetical protein